MDMLDDITKITDIKSRSISAENPTGDVGMGGRATKGTGEHASRELGVGWKVSPSINIGPESSATIADINGSGIIRHIWMTCHPDYWRDLVIEFYWDGESEPAVQVPFGDFFCNGWCKRSNVSSLPVVVNPAGGMNSYWQMPFANSAKVIIRNLGQSEFPLFFQIDYTLERIDNRGYFHAFWTRNNPVKFKQVHEILPKVHGRGQYVGTYIAYQSNNNGWWGEGEVKFYIDDDVEFPTICGTGTEDYFGGAWNFEQPVGTYCKYSTMFSGLPQVITPDGLYNSQQRFGMYRWHVPDPVYFSTGLRVTIQALGWKSHDRYLPEQDDISSTAFFYMDSPSALPRTNNLTIDDMEVV